MAEDNIEDQQSNKRVKPPRPEIPDKRTPGRPKGAKNKGERVINKTLGRPKDPEAEEKFKEYQKLTNGGGSRERYKADNESVKQRFFEAIEFLIGRERIQNLANFCIMYGINLSNLTLSKRKDNMIIQLHLLIILIRDFGISSDWLMLGEGKMFQSNK